MTGMPISTLVCAFQCVVYAFWFPFWPRLVMATMACHGQPWSAMLVKGRPWLAPGPANFPTNFPPNFLVNFLGRLWLAMAAVASHGWPRQTMFDKSTTGRRGENGPTTGRHGVDSKGLDILYATRSQPWVRFKGLGLTESVSRFWESGQP